MVKRGMKKSSGTPKPAANPAGKANAKGTGKLKPSVMRSVMRGMRLGPMRLSVRVFPMKVRKASKGKRLVYYKPGGGGAATVGLAKGAQKELQKHGGAVMQVDVNVTVGGASP